MLSFGYGVTGAAPNRRWVFVSFSQNGRRGTSPSGPLPAISSSGPRNGCATATAKLPSAARAGRGSLSSRDHVLRNPAPGVDQLIFRLEPAAGCVLADQFFVRERGLRIVIAPPVPRVAGQRVQVPPVFLDVLAVIALRSGQAERALLQDRVGAVPQCQPQALPLLDAAESGQPVLAPAVGTGAGVLVRQVAQRLAVRAVILRGPSPTGAR